MAQNATDRDASGFLNWWHAETGKLHQSVMAYVRTIDNQQSLMYEKFVQLAACYDTNTRGPTRPTNANGKSIITENLFARNADTIAANVAETDIRLRIQTDGADWEHQMLAKDLESYASDLADLLDVGPKCRIAFKNGGAIKGTGLNKVFINPFDEIEITPVPVDNIVVDEADCAADGTTRQLHYRCFWDRDDLIAEYPEFEEEIRRAQTTGTWWSARKWAGYRPYKRNQVVVIESWRLPSGPLGHPKYVAGRHSIVIDGCDLVDEEWNKAFFPFAKFVWNQPTEGWYGIGLIERIAPHQRLLNIRNGQINMSLDRSASPIIYYHAQDASLMVKKVDQIGTQVAYRHAPPTTVAGPVVNAEIYQSRQDIKADASDETGISRMAQTGNRPSGVNAAVALRELRDVGSQRFSIQEKAFERFWLDTVWLMLDCCKDLGKKAPKIPKASEYGKDPIPWGRVDMRELAIEMSAASSLGNTPAGRQQRVVELAQAGMITTDEAREPGFITEDSQGLEFKAERKPLGVTGQDQAALVDGSKEVPNRRSFRAIRRGSEAHVDGLVGHRDLAWRGEDIRDDLLRFAGPAHVRSNQRREVGLRVRADDTDHVDDRLELAGVANELASKHRLFDGCVCWRRRPERFEVTLEFECVGEVLFKSDSA